MRAAHNLGTVAIQHNFAVARAIGIQGTPAAAKIDSAGIVRDIALGEADVRVMLQQLAGTERIDDAVAR